MVDISGIAVGTVGYIRVSLDKAASNGAENITVLNKNLSTNKHVESTRGSNDGHTKRF